MAYCPKCSEQLDRSATKCSSCGYNFKITAKTILPPDWVHSGFADMALMFAQVCTVLMILFQIIGYIIALSMVGDQIIIATGSLIIKCVFYFGVLVAFTKVRALKPRHFD